MDDPMRPEPRTAIRLILLLFIIVNIDIYRDRAKFQRSNAEIFYMGSRPELSLDESLGF
jgi:hypothetical protein